MLWKKTFTKCCSGPQHVRKPVGIENTTFLRFVYVEFEFLSQNLLPTFIRVFVRCFLPNAIRHITEKYRSHIHSSWSRCCVSNTNFNRIGSIDFYFSNVRTDIIEHINTTSFIFTKFENTNTALDYWQKLRTLRHSIATDKSILASPHFVGGLNYFSAFHTSCSLFPIKSVYISK